jgi:YidC/Oxa1 family membrane protein insertase
MQPHQKEMAAMQERVKQTSVSRNPAALAKANREMKDFYRNLGVSPFGGLVGFLQLPITFGIFFAVKGMCDLPVEQMKFSGLEMFPDLTATDPTLILPLVMTVAVNAQLLVCFLFCFL